MIKKLIFLYILFSQALSYSNVVWNTTYIKREILYNETVVDAYFHFKNNGKDKLKFYNITPSCGCIEASINKKEYLPGENGILHVKTLFSNKQNIQKYYIDTHYNDSRKSKIRLDIELIPTFPFKISTNKLVWINGEEPIPKGITLHFSKDKISVENIKNAITISNDAYKIYVLYDDENNSYEINVIPPQTNVFSTETLSIALNKITPEFPKGNYIIEIAIMGKKSYITSINDFVKIKSKTDKSVLIIDVRNKIFYDKGCIDNAVNIPIKDIKENSPLYNNMKSTISTADVVVIYCSSKDCNDSEHAYQEILKIKKDNIYIFKGGWAEWEENMANKNTNE